MLQLIINGIQVGALYALIAVGFSLIFGATKVFHFAHGATFTIAAYTFYYMYSVAEIHWLLSIIGASVASILFGVLLDRLIYAPIQRHEGSFFTVFVASLGIAIVAENVIGIIFGRGFVSVSTPLSMSVDITEDLYISPLFIVAIVCAFIFFILLQLFLTRTNIGIALRGLSENKTLIQVYGLSASQLSTVVFALGSLMVVPAAILTGASSGMNPSMTHHVMLISIAATIVGGVGSLKGAAYAGMLLGIVESISLLYLETQWSEALTFVVLFLFIVFKPSGFFGQKITN